MYSTSNSLDLIYLWSKAPLHKGPPETDYCQCYLVLSINEEQYDPTSQYNT